MAGMELNDVPETIEIAISQKENGAVVKKEYVLSELTGPNGIKYSNVTASRANTEIDADGTVKFLGMKDTGDMDYILVSLCLYHKDGSPVSEEEVRSFKHQTVEKLAKKAREINGMIAVNKKADGEKETHAKN